MVSAPSIDRRTWLQLGPRRLARSGGAPAPARPRDAAPPAHSISFIPKGRGTPRQLAEYKLAGEVRLETINLNDLPGGITAAIEARTGADIIIMGTIGRPLPARARGRLRALRVEGERQGGYIPGVGGGGAGERPVAGAA